MTASQFCDQLENYYAKAMTSMQSEPIQKFLEPYAPVKRKDLYELVISSCEHLPRLAKLKELVEVMDADPHHSGVGCPRCEGTGWIEVRLEGETLDGRREVNAVKTCRCRREEAL